MDTMPGTEGLPINHERVEWLKRLRKGSGITRFPEGFPFELFGVTDWGQFVDRLTVILAQIPNWPAKVAIENALAFSFAFDWRMNTLTEETEAKKYRMGATKGSTGDYG